MNQRRKDDMIFNPTNINHHKKIKIIIDKMKKFEEVSQEELMFYKSMCSIATINKNKIDFISKTHTISFQ